MTENNRCFEFWWNGQGQRPCCTWRLSLDSEDCGFREFSPSGQSWEMGEGEWLDNEGQLHRE